MDMFLSDSDSADGFKTITERYKGSASRCARLLVLGVLAYGIVDTAADNTIIGKSHFRKVVTVAWLKKRNLEQADKILRNHDQLTSSWMDVRNSQLHLAIRKCPHKSTLSWMQQRCLSIIGHCELHCIIQQLRNGEEVARPMSSLKPLSTPQQI